MGTAHETTQNGVDELERWILDNAGNGGAALDRSLAILGEWSRSGQTKLALSTALLLQEMMSGRIAESLAILGARANLIGEPFRADCRRTALDLFGDDRRLKGLVPHAGFDDGVDLNECVRRLGVLIGFKAGAYCEDRTWGFGKLNEIDDFYNRVIVDFDRKRGHHMSFRYAGETLRLLSDDHILVRRAKDPKAFEALLADAPGTVIRDMLATYGPMTIAQTQERVTRDLHLPEPRWKAFWDAARKAIKDDPLIEIPSRRSEPMRLLARARRYDKDWLLDFATERHLPRIVERLAEFEEAVPLPLGAEAKEIIQDRMRFLMLGAQGTDPALLIKGLLAVERLGLDEETTETAPRRASLMTPAAWTAAVTAAVARDLEPFVDLMARREGAPFVTLLLDTLNAQTHGPFCVIMEHLCSRGHRDEVRATLRRLFAGREASPVALVWCCRKWSKADEMGVLSVGELFGEIADLMGRPQTAEALKMQNALRGLLDDTDWLKEMLDLMPAAELEHTLLRMRDLRGWDETSRRSFMGKALRLYPRFQSMIAGGSSRDKTSDAELRFTSWRSYRERQEQLKKLVEIDIPENSREIGVARSYGDLRENFEYQAAKDTQRILMQRQREMEADLRQVKGSDYSRVAADKAAPGTIVEVVFPTGLRCAYVILGEWDRDEKLGIVSSKSRMAECLMGHGPGDAVLLSQDGVDVTCTIASVSGLSPEIRDWIGAERPQS